MRALQAGKLLRSFGRSQLDLRLNTHLDTVYITPSLESFKRVFLHRHRLVVFISIPDLQAFATG